MESSPLILGGSGPGLSWAMASLCIVDMFGVFPVVALPKPIIDCGWVGVPLALFVICLQIYTARMLGKCWLIAESLDPRIVEKSRCPYAALAELCWGARARCGVSLLLNVALFGGGVPNLLLASQMLQLVGLKETNYGVNVSFCYWLLILGVFMCPLMWLASPKDMKCVAVTSCLTVLTVAALTWTCMVLDVAVPDRTPLPVNWEAVAVAYGIIAFQFDIHPMVLTVQVDMAKKRQLDSAILAAFAVTGSLFLVTTALASWRYGEQTRHNLLQGLPGNGMLYVTIVLVTVQICLSMVVGGSPLFQALEDKLAVPREFGWRRCALRSTVLLSAVLVAEMVPRFDLVMGLLGGALTGPLMFVCPPLIYLRLGAMRRDADARNADAEHQASLYRLAGDGFKLASLEPQNGHLSGRHNGVVFSNATFDAVVGDDTHPLLIRADHVIGDSRRRRDETSKTVTHLTDSAIFGPVRTPSDALSTVTKITSGVIIVLGVLATVAASYFTLRDTLRYARITPACFPWW